MNNVPHTTVSGYLTDSIQHWMRSGISALRAQALPSVGIGLGLVRVAVRGEIPRSQQDGRRASGQLPRRDWPMSVSKGYPFAKIISKFSAGRVVRKSFRANLHPALCAAMKSPAKTPKTSLYGE